MSSLWLDRPGPIETDQFVPGADYNDVVVGAGLTGLVTAVLLARAGRRVALLEARHVGAVTTGNTTAKLSLLQGTVLSNLIRFHSERVAAAYDGHDQDRIDGLTVDAGDWWFNLRPSNTEPLLRLNLAQDLTSGRTAGSLTSDKALHRG